MRCHKCGYEVNNNDVFCPNCSTTLRMTADYDFIQAKIGGKVDQYLNNDYEDEIDTDEMQNRFYHDEDYVIDQIDINNRPRRERTSNVPDETIAITRSLYGKDTIYKADALLEYPTDDERYSESEEDIDFKRKRAKARALAKKKKKQRIIIICIAAAVIVAIGIIIGVVIGNNNSKKKEKGKIEDKIECNLKDGETYTTPLSVNIASKNNYRLFYTLDGTEPTITSTKFGQTLQIDNKNYNEFVKGENGEVTINVVSFNNSSVKAASFSIKFFVKKAALAAPTIEPGSGDYTEPTKITITATNDAAIYYTFDGTTPTTASNRYNGPFSMKRGNFVLNAIAIDDTGMQSEVTSCVYNLYIEPQISYDDAYSRVISYLKERDLIESTETKTPHEYPAPGGGKRRVNSAGDCEIENNIYYVFQIDFINEDETITSTTYLGVNDQDGSVSSLNRSGDKYVLS